MTSLESNFEAFIRRHKLVRPYQTVLLAVSGGVDSMVMMHLFTQLPTRWNLKLAVAHINHQLRGQESIDDEQFVRDTSDSLGIPCYVERTDTLAYAHNGKISKQEAARELRYSFFNRARQEISADAVATAHQANDNAETVLLNILRGSGIRGLAGIPLRRESGNVIRPLLFAYRDEIEEYARRSKIVYRKDTSNDSLAYQRNLLRHKVIPQLRSENDADVLGSLNQVAVLMRELSASLQAKVKKRLDAILSRDSSGNLIVEIPSLAAEPELVQEHIILELFQLLRVEPSEEKIASVLRLSSLPTGKSIKISKSYAIFRDRKRLICCAEPAQDQPQTTRVAVGNEYRFPSFSITIGVPEPTPASFVNNRGVEFVDAERLGKQLVLRTWQKGDWFIPLGMRARKKLSNFFTDEKIPRFEKSHIPVLESDGQILWVCGRRLDDRFKVTDKTRAVVKLSYHHS